MTPKISIITVVYNDVQHIEKTIQNVLKQSYSNLEYIVVDGASTDGTLDIIRRYEEKLRWISEPDDGIYDAMEKGIRIATGEWILFRNCGDFFINTSVIEDLFALYDEDRNEDFLLAKSRYFKEYGYKDIKPAILEKNIFDSMPVLHPSTFIRRSTQLRFPFHLEYRNSADYCFFIEAFLNGATYRYFDIVISLFDNEAGASTDDFGRSLSENIKILIKKGASDVYVDEIKKKLKMYKIKQIVKKLIPFYSYYHELHLKNDGWVRGNKEVVLKDV